MEFDPTKGQELAWSAEGSVKVYQRFIRPPDAGAWGRFRTALGKPPFDILLQVEGRKEGKIHLYPEEIEKVAADKIDGWVKVLEGRIQTYHQGGWEKNQGVPAGPDHLIDFDATLTAVLQEEKQGPILKEFKAVLVLLANAGKSREGSGEFRDYWQLMEVDKSPAVALGCAVLKEGKGGRYEVADMNYFASNGYYGAVSLYGIWPYGD